jgi:hypothetical protein
MRIPTLRGTPLRQMKRGFQALDGEMNLARMLGRLTED